MNSSGAEHTETGDFACGDQLTQLDRGRTESPARSIFTNYIFLLYSANGGRPGLCPLFQDDSAPDQKIFSMGTEALFLKIGKRLSQCQIEIAPPFGMIARIPHLVNEMRDSGYHPTGRSNFNLALRQAFHDL